MICCRIKLITRFTLDISHLREYKFRHSSQVTLNSIYSCGDDIETTIHYLHHCPNYLDERNTLLDILQNFVENIHDKNDFQRLFSVSSNNDASNIYILNASIQYILAIKRFDVPLNKF